MANPTQRTYIVTGSQPDIDAFEAILGQINYLRSVGSSRTIAVHCDGDGALSLVIRDANSEKLPRQQPRPDRWGYDADDNMSVGLNGPFAPDPLRKRQ